MSTKLHLLEWVNVCVFSCVYMCALSVCWLASANVSYSSLHVPHPSCMYMTVNSSHEICIAMEPVFVGG